MGDPLEARWRRIDELESNLREEIDETTMQIAWGHIEVSVMGEIGDEDLNLLRRIGVFQDTNLAELRDSLGTKVRALAAIERVREVAFAEIAKQRQSLPQRTPPTSDHEALEAICQLLRRKQWPSGSDALEHIYSIVRTTSHDPDEGPTDEEDD